MLALPTIRWSGDSFQPKHSSCRPKKTSLKLEELLRAGADFTVLDRASSEEIRDVILGSLTQKA
ncbi:LOW QUALITY PROTEIN: hypothetical protein HID58_041579 [Brassica napus]|uniref:Uncharacterized protein n=1 Tax=Brassica napus TaxID=3708 RepID=A0ABQ8BCV0_BRANA|nr:LOW QUALITY PROTEIN: hypothetical protein HID58_041579 [Brassica napus]